LRNEMMEELTVGEEEKGGLWQRLRSKEQPEHGKMKQNEPPDERKRGKIRQRRHEHSLGEVQGTFPISRAREATGQRSVSRG